MTERITGSRWTKNQFTKFQRIFSKVHVQMKAKIALALAESIETNMLDAAHYLNKYPDTRRFLLENCKIVERFISVRIDQIQPLLDDMERIEHEMIDLYAKHADSVGIHDACINLSKFNKLMRSVDPDDEETANSNNEQPTGQDAPDEPEQNEDEDDGEDSKLPIHITPEFFWQAVVAMDWPLDFDSASCSDRLDKYLSWYGNGGAEHYSQRKPTDPKISLADKDMEDCVYGLLHVFGELFQKLRAHILDAHHKDHSIHGGFSDDGLDYLCGNIIGHGQKAYEEAFTNPASIAKFHAIEGFSSAFDRDRYRDFDDEYTDDDDVDGYDQDQKVDPDDPNARIYKGLNKLLRYIDDIKEDTSDMHKVVVARPRTKAYRRRMFYRKVRAAVRRTLTHIRREVAVVGRGIKRFFLP